MRLHDVEIRRLRFDAEIYRSRRGIGRQVNAYRLESYQQAIGTDVVRPQRLVVESAGVGLRHREDAAIQYQVAVDVADALRAQLPQQQPELLERQLGIAAALEVEVAGQDAVRHRRLDANFGLPGVGRAEHFQGRERGDELHHRGRIHRLCGIDAETRLRRPDFLDVDADGAGGNGGGLQRARYGGGQARVGGLGGRRAGAKESRQQGG